METRCEEDHDVRFLPAAVFDLKIRNLVEFEGCHLLPHLEGPSDGLVRVVLADLRGVVLNTADVPETKRKEFSRFRHNIELL